MKRLFLLVLFGIFAAFGAVSGVAVQAETYAYSPQFVNGTNQPLVGVTVTIYNHGAAQNPTNVIATGTTDAYGHIQPAVTLTIGNTYDFTTSSPQVPVGQFTATAPRQLVLVPGPPGPTGPPGSNATVTITGSGGAVVTNPTPGTYGIFAPTPQPTISLTGSGGVAVAEPSPNVYVITGPTAAPTPNILAGTNITSVVQSGSNYTINAATQGFGGTSPGGCILNGSSGVYGTYYACAGYTTSTFVIPAVGNTVSINVGTGNANFQKYTPITVTDGTNSISGYVSSAGSVVFSSISMTVTAINQGASGNTMGQYAEIEPGNLAGAAASITSPSYPLLIVTNPSPNNFVIYAQNQQATALLAGGCAQSNDGATSLVSTGYSCGGQASGFTIPAVGSTVTFTVINGSDNILEYVPVSISDGIHSISGYTTARGSGSAITVYVTSINEGSVGDTMNGGAEISQGAYPLISPIDFNVVRVGVQSTPSTSNALEIGSNVSGGWTNFLACPSSDTGVAACTVAGVLGDAWEVTNSGTPPLVAQDLAGDMGIAGAYTSASRRALKEHIHDLSDQETMHLLHATKIVQYCYKRQHCAPGETREIGFIADDTSALLSGPRHDRIDIGSMASVAFAGAQESIKEIDRLRSFTRRLEYVIFVLEGLLAVLFAAVIILCIRSFRRP